MSSLYPFLPVQRRTERSQPSLLPEFKHTSQNNPDVSINTSTSRLVVAIYNV